MIFGLYQKSLESGDYCQPYVLSKGEHERLFQLGAFSGKLNNLLTCRRKPHPEQVSGGGG